VYSFTRKYDFHRNLSDYHTLADQIVGGFAFSRGKLLVNAGSRDLLKVLPESDLSAAP